MVGLDDSGFWVDGGAVWSWGVGGGGVDVLSLGWWVGLGLRMLRIRGMSIMRVVGVEVWRSWEWLSIWVVEARMGVGLGWLGWRWWKLVGGIGVVVVWVERGRRLMIEVVGVVVLRMLVVAPVQREVGVDSLERRSERGT